MTDTADSASRLESFLELSEALTGFDRLSREIASRHIVRLSRDPHDLVSLLAALDEFEIARRDSRPLDQVITALLAGDNAPTIRRILVLWYSGSFLRSDGTLASEELAPEAWFAGLMWRAMGAHPPGLSGGYFGHWRYPPEE